MAKWLPTKLRTTATNESDLNTTPNHIFGRGLSNDFYCYYAHFFEIAGQYHIKVMESA